MLRLAQVSCLLDTASVSCKMFWIIIRKYFANRGLRYMEEVHIRAYDTDTYLLTVKGVPAHGPTKCTDK